MLYVSEQIQIPEQELIFSWVRSGGPGGQHVNKTSTKAVLRWNVLKSRALPADARRRFLLRFASRLNGHGELILKSQKRRCRSLNAQDCRQRLKDMLLQTEQQPKQRKRTVRTRGSAERRLQAKKIRSERKRLRRRPASENS